MKVGMLGTGTVGQTLGSAFIALGHEVMMGSRSAVNENGVAWAGREGERATAGTFADAAAFGELVVLATRGVENEQVVRLADPANFAGKVLIDTTNPLDFSQGMPPRLAIGHADSAGEQVQRLLPEARVVKAFNIVGSGLMFRPDLGGLRGDMFIAGNDDGANATVGQILDEFGWDTIDLGGIEASRYLEPMCMAWVTHAARTGAWNHAWKLLPTR